MLFNLSSTFDSGYFHNPLPEDANLIIGAGHFGKRAATILSQVSTDPLYIVDKHKSSLEGIKGLLINKILCDGIDLIADNFQMLSPKNTIIPAIPLHLAFEWLKNYLGKGFTIKKIEVPEGSDTKIHSVALN